MRAPLVLALVLAGCGVEANGDTTALSDQLRAVSERMHLRFAAVERIERGIVTDRLGEVHQAATTIASLEDPEVLPDWQPYLAGVRRAAIELAAAADVVEAAHRAGELGHRCARCHVAIGARIAFRERPRPDTGAQIQHTMAGHEWGVARMWEGLIGPSDERWLAGARVLQRAPLTYVAESGALGISNNVMRVRVLAGRAALARTAFDRAELFGDLLGTCASCHAAIRDRPGGSR